MAYNLAVHGPHCVAEGSNFIRQVQHQTVICPVHLARHSPADTCHYKDIKTLCSQINASPSNEKASMHWLKVHPPEASSQSIPVAGMIRLNPAGNLNSSEGNRPRAHSKLNLRVQFAEVVDGNQKEEREPNESRLVADDSASTSSSIGQASQNSLCTLSSGTPTDETEVQSCLRSPLDHMGSLEDFLPIKRGLSKVFSGKSRSFTSLSEVSSVRDLAKAENPYAKKRKWLHGHGNSNVKNSRW
ncbi:hypothetical protein O6H91_07G004800 [Diphasiastrum complanatum]|uniref:Uncharacterized protein n=1 Tax=Diphasiastrum complanatum TaxID=34168 RepID=A0ACC2D218_DIPCM|nr:hypothetical protein O6H91_07G004800 [Diphasiastrum complanatum]